MIRLLALMLLVLPATVRAQDAGCPVDASQQLYDLTQRARAADVPLLELGEAANTMVEGCGPDRVLLGQIMAMFTAAGIALEPPENDRFTAHLHAFRTNVRLTGMEAGPFDPVPLKDPDGSGIEWTTADERDAYWDLMFAMSSDFLIGGIHEQLFIPGELEQIGCGLYPAEEASALARHAINNVDGGEMLARVIFLATRCDSEGHEVAGYAAQYFANHYRARGEDEDYVGLTGGDIRAGLQRYLPIYLDGAAEGPLFDAATVTELMDF
ncbi:hypothetical protein [Maritimibacter fusiformis]|uniref:Uncharacterized protein n=1 Tax=Maritimibacter fusiformis TaxID=2603819 RepID=A0A5D0RK15_9RHOB|nr:hypothetical protein [Maritimibacter fusiformis]TYB81960.1 hypothetical protein FVF75_04270 [Maritimibacter fusiformis]